MPIVNRFAEFHPEMTAWRRELHQHPQTSYQETYAATFVADRLRAWGIEVHEGIAGTGLVGVLKGTQGESGKAIGLRADMDALDLVEENDFAHCSKTPGKMHGCGHDGHTATLLGAARYLAETRNFAGTVHFIFQPAEEGGGGAARMIEEGLFKRFPCNAVFGLHNWPDLPAGTVGLRAGPMLASADKFKLIVTGRGGHAAYPQQTIDPLLTACQIVTAWQSIVSRAIAPLDNAVVSVTQFNGGLAYNVIPNSVTLCGTARAFRPEVRDMIQGRMQSIAENIAAAFGASIDFAYMRDTSPTINWPEETEFAAAIAAEIVGADNVNRSIEPTMGAEDFGAMLMEQRGCYIFMGAQDATHTAKLHNPRYDFNDELLPMGASYFAKLAERYLAA